MRQNSEPLGGPMQKVELRACLIGANDTTETVGIIIHSSVASSFLDVEVYGNDLQTPNKNTNGNKFKYFSSEQQ